MPRRRARLPWIWPKRPIAKSAAAWVRPAALWVQKGSNEPPATPLVVQVSAHLQAVATDLDAGHLWIAISDHVSPIRSCSSEFSWQNFSLAKPFLLQIPSMPSKLHEQRPSSSASLPPAISTSEELLTSLESYSLATGLLMHHLAWEPSEPSEFEGWNVESPASIRGFELEVWPWLLGFWFRGPGCGQLLQAVCHGLFGCRTSEACCPALETLSRFHGKR